MIRRILFLWLALIFLSRNSFVSAALSKEILMPNRLARQKSPYLLQHKDNPVDWYPWSDEAFQKAKKENKPVFLSIGYSTCHWCHVMERESFENGEIAAILNEHFVSIKVDREERPDIDSIYMTAVVSMIGQGGWPLSVFLTPDGKPFYGGTYFPPKARWGAPGFSDILSSVAQAWETRRDEIMQSSSSITELLQNRAQQVKTDNRVLGKETLGQTYEELSANFDERSGGFGTAPKFPMGHSLSFLLRYWKRADEAQALAMVEKTLEQMAKGGIFDHLGGGFHRYSTDQFWHVPHFEKMLYDQAVLARAYLEAFQATQNIKYAETAKEIFEYVLRDMRDPKGGFYSAEDADSLSAEAGTQKHAEKKEGAFYVWSEEEALQILGSEDGAVFNYYFGVEAGGNAKNDPYGEFLGKNILFLARDIDETARHFKKPSPDVLKIIKQSKSKLFSARLKRPRPHLDDKVLTDWNVLMISSLALASRVLDEPRYKEAAESSAQFILKKLVDKKGRLLHRYRDGESAILATLDDYAFFIHGLIDLYEAAFHAEYLEQAKRLTDEMVRLFWDEEPGGFFLSATDAEKLIFRQKDFYDGALPSGNSVAALDLIRMGALTLGQDFIEKAQGIFAAAGSEVAQRPSGYTQLLLALDFLIGPGREIVIAGNAGDAKVLEMLKAVYQAFLPSKVVVFHPGEEKAAGAIEKIVPFIREQPMLKGKATAYVCENHVCQLPVNELRELKELLNRK